MKKRAVLLVLGALGVLAISLVVVFAIWIGPHSVQQILSGMLEVSQPADIRHTKDMTNAHLSLQYPGNWRIDTTDPDYDPEKYLDINAPAQGKVMVYVLPSGVSPRDGVDNMAQKLKKLVMNARQTPFESWGPHQGYGVQLSGLIVGFEGRIRCFGLGGSSDATILVVEMRYDEDEEHNREGYELISRTFRLKGGDLGT